MEFRFCKRRGNIQASARVYTSRTSHREQLLWLRVSTTDLGLDWGPLGVKSGFLSRDFLSWILLLISSCSLHICSCSSLIRFTTDWKHERKGKKETREKDRWESKGCKEGISAVAAQIHEAHQRQTKKRQRMCFPSDKVYMNRYKSEIMLKIQFK